MRGLIRAIVDFVVGDDIWIAVSVIVLLGTGAALERFGIDVWWVLPLGIPAALWASLTRARSAS